MSLSLPEVLSRFGEYKQSGKEYRVRCPVHGDSTPSLDIAEGDSGILFQCRSAGCQTIDILSAVGLTWGDILPQYNGHRDAWDHVHEYKSRAGVLLYRVYRRGSGKTKVIRQQAANGAWNLKGVPLVPYRLPELAGPAIFVVEGEKAADALWRIGYEATCNSGGATKWRESDTAALKAAGITSIVILPDNDAAGTEHADLVEASAKAAGLAARRVQLPGLPPSGDAYDWLQDHTADDLAVALKPEPPAILADLADALDVVKEGQTIASVGIQYVIDGLVPAYGMLGFLVAAAKVGKTTLGHSLAAAVANGDEFLGRGVQARRVLVIAAEDPPEYTAYLARHLNVLPGRMTFSRTPLQLDHNGLSLIINTIDHGEYGLVLIASWQAVITSLVKDENDNAGSARVVEMVKQATRGTHIPWLVDAHAGKGEDQGEDADPTKALRGASAAAGAADYLLSLRYADGPFSTRRRLSGKGRFVNVEPFLIDYNIETGQFDTTSSSNSAIVESTWALILATGAVDNDLAGAAVIGVRAGLGDDLKQITGGQRRLIALALKERPGIERQSTTIKGKTITRYRRIDEGF